MADANLNTPQSIIMSQAIPHTCVQGQCSGNHPAGWMEIPSITFVQATQATPLKPDGSGEPLAPD